MRPHNVPPFAVSLLIGLLAAPVPVVRAMWSRDGLPVASTGLNYQAKVLADNAGGCFVVWHGGANTDIFARRLGPDGQSAAGWPPGEPLAISSAAGVQEDPVMVLDLTGGALFFWQDARNGSNYDIYSQHLSGAGQLVPGWQPGGSVISAAAGNQCAPAIAPDGQGGALVAWYDSRNGAGNYDIYAQRVTGDGDVAPDNWPAAGLWVCGAANNQLAPSIVADGTGGAFIAWQDYRKGNEYDIHVQHVTLEGGIVLNWPAGGLIVCAAANSQFSPVLASDGVGGVFVVWQDYRSGRDNDIYAQHLTAGGAIVNGWPKDGRPVCQALNSQYYPVVASDLGGGVVIGWQDYRSGIDNDVYTQHLTASGGLAAGWREDGLLTSGAANGQFSPRITPDFSGGAFIVWHDCRSGGNDDIYAQQVNDAGQLNPLWPPDGLPVCLALNAQEFPVVATSGVGSAICVWQDQRTGDVAVNAVYAQQTLSTDVGEVEQPPALVSLLSRGGPNPFRASIQFRLTLMQPAAVKAEVIDVAGRRIRTLASQVFPVGNHTLIWDGMTNGGDLAAPGVYLVRVRWPGFEKTQRVVRLR